MKIGHREISFNTIRFKLIAGVFSILLPLTILLVYGNNYAIGIIHNQVAETNKNLLALYMDQIDTGLAVAENNLIKMISDSAYRDIYNQMSADRYILKKAELTEKLARDALSYQTIDAFFYFSSERQDLTLGFNLGGSILERDRISTYLKKFLQDRPLLNDDNYRRWVIFWIGADSYLFRLFPAGSDYMGAWVNMKELLIPLNMINLGDEGAAIIVDSHGQKLASSKPITDSQLDLSNDFSRYYLTGTDNRFLAVGAPSKKGDIYLTAVIPDQWILENLIWLRQIILFIAIFTFLLLPISLYFLRRTILIPVNRILTAMKRIRGGDIEVRIPAQRSSDEFQIVDETFNNMLDQIHELKINIYEEKINSQHEELERLRLQINPHFFLNSLNILYRLTQSRKYDLVQEMTRSLIEYFRYSFRKNQALVPLREEMAHVRNYLKIQALRYPKALTCEINMPDYVGMTPVPPLIVQNFAENSIKYAIMVNKPVQLTIQASFIEAAPECAACVEILITDTGPGFPADVLAQLQAGIPMKDGGESRIGTWNARRRLQLIYQGQATIEFANQDPQGAVVRIRLPLRPTGRQENPEEA